MVQKGIIRAVTHLTNGMDMHVLVLLSFTCNGKPYSSAYIFISLSFYFYQNFTVLLGRVKHVLIPVLLNCGLPVFLTCYFADLNVEKARLLGRESTRLSTKKHISKCGGS
jgi:hypothetical protein